MTERKNPVAYAEDILGVNSILEQTMKARDELDKVLGVLDGLHDEKRSVEQKIESREMDIAIDERGKHSDMSQAQMEKHLKMVFHKDPELKKLKERLLEIQNSLSGADMDRKLQERTIEIGCARMNQLGGYLNYLAAAKNASIATQSQ